MLKKLLLLFVFSSIYITVFCQQIAVIKKELETTPDPIGYVKYKLKKKFKIDTVTVVTTTNFVGISDSIAYKGKLGKVYGPFKKGNYLLKVLAKLPNTFYHVSHIVLDTSTFNVKFANNLADTIIAKIKTGRAGFDNMALTYSSDHASSTKGGDLGWFIRGIMLPQLDEAIAAHKKGDIFKVWTDVGLHIVTIKDNPKKDDGFALLLRVLL
ncbi:peptidyl-prolyl cis-trans isomerase [Ferruginibacter lapsinanis]|uniref:peptidylprolyl isomerase n=1 Tax=Ferruginibacter lapsinanis TaxID=563172 RepID=UPI001E417444|nr:peptidylprolyl isomerase [Ferruginibacter lapsinanis]UEG49940.1 peptidyl-prolyl cis-trans isomerase [Ferruginibacter lapsinanis]